MSLDPTAPTEPQLRIKKEELEKSFNSGSPYFDMFRCGYYGVPLEDCLQKCNMNGIVIRQKDIEAWEDGIFKREMKMSGNEDMTIRRSATTDIGIPVDNAKLIDFPQMPQGWKGTTRRFFPCSEDNKPMQKWGWSRNYTPELFTQADAKALSPVGWIGQNMLYQPFVVMDIDGVGHGVVDQQTIDFGRLFEDYTLKMEDPNKIGSFHLYFSTDRLLPVRHWGWAKIDFMGNAVNAAVYLKNKVSNGKPMMPLTEEIWQHIQDYQKSRKEESCHLIQEETSRPLAGQHQTNQVTLLQMPMVNR